MNWNTDEVNCSCQGMDEINRLGNQTMAPARGRSPVKIERIEKKLKETTLEKNTLKGNNLKENPLKENNVKDDNSKQKNIQQKNSKENRKNLVPDSPSCNTRRH
jgi:hypothetical protein